MQLRRAQAGLGLWGWMYVAATLGTIAIVAVKSVPVMTNQMAISKAVHNVAGDPGLGAAGLGEVRSALQRYWDIEDIRDLHPRDVRIVKTSAGRVLAYQYQAKIHLFYNVDLLYTFGEEVPMRSANS